MTDLLLVMAMVDKNTSSETEHVINNDLRIKHKYIRLGELKMYSDL